MNIKNNWNGWGKGGGISYINFLKGFAILGVIADHTVGYLYANPKIQALSFYSVSLFILLSGITSFMSMDKRNITNYNFGYLKKRLRKLLFPYIFATFFYVIYSQKFFDLSIFLKTVIGFNATGPFYFILFFLQLIIISPIIFNIINWTNKQKYKNLLIIFLIVAIIFMSYICTKCTFVIDVYGGGKYVFGGSYLILYLIGMIFANLKIKFKTFKIAIIWWLISFFALIMFLYNYLFNTKIIQFVNNILPIWTFNPPGITFMIYSILIFIFFFNLYSLIEFINTKCLIIFRPIEICGQYSMSIFLYHMLFFSIFVNLATNYSWLAENVVVYKVGIIVFMIVLPILFKICYNKFKYYFIKEIFNG